MMSQTPSNHDTGVDADAFEAARALLGRFRGHMTIEHLSQGIKACLKNARGLVFEAELLAKNQRYARAMCLAMTALEEIGKTRVLKSMVRIPKTNQKLWADRWNLFSSHESKSAYAFVDTLPDEAYLFSELVLSAAADNAALVGLGERIRQAGLYVDWLASEDRWLNPLSEITDEMAESRIRIAKTGLSRLSRLCEQGWFSVGVLQIEHDILAPVNDDIPKSAGVLPEHLEQLGQVAPAKLREFYRLVTEKNLVHLPEDFAIQGTPWRQFIDASE